MDATLVAVIGLALMALLMLLGQPIAFTMLAAGVIGNAYLLTPAAATHLLATNIWEQFSSYGLSVIPLFVLMGQFAYRAGTTERLYRAAYTWVGRLPGGLAGTTIAASILPGVTTRGVSPVNGVSCGLPRVHQARRRKLSFSPWLCRISQTARERTLGILHLAQLARRATKPAYATA